MPFFYYYGGYINYYLFMLPGILLALWASIRVKTTFRKYSSVNNVRGLTGADAARAVLSACGVAGVRVERVSGELTDHYDPKTNVIRLSDAVYDSRSVAAVGVAAHEAGHAAQYASDYRPIKWRTALIPVCNIGTQLALPLLILGTVLNAFGLMALGVALFSLSVLVQLVTLPVELNASRRALRVIQERELLYGDEYKAARQTLTAAALTYVAALLQSLLSLLYFVLRLNQSGRR